MDGWLNILDFITFVYLSWSNDDAECGFLWACIGDRMISIDLILCIQAALCMHFDCFLLYISGHADTQLMSSLKSFSLYFSKMAKSFENSSHILPNRLHVAVRLISDTLSYPLMCHFLVTILVPDFDVICGLNITEQIHHNMMKSFCKVYNWF